MEGALTDKRFPETVVCLMIPDEFVENGIN